MSNAITLPEITSLAKATAALERSRAERLRRMRRFNLVRHAFLVLLSFITIFPLLWMVAASSGHLKAGPSPDTADMVTY
jgi:ABC-type maltose transport system permease subunit